MSEMAKKARADNKAKAKRISTGDPHAKVDASSWSPPEPLNTEAKTGLRPVSRRAYRTGGKVSGAESKKNAGRKARKSGGNIANEIVNRDVKEANAEKFGKTHTGGMKHGGRSKKADGGVPAARMEFGKPRGTPLPGSGAQGFKKGGKADGEFEGTRPTGGRKARKDGGRTKKSGKTNINIIISAGSKQPEQNAGQMGPMPPPPPPPKMPPMMPPPGPPPGGPPMGGAPPGMPPGGPPPMMRKSGGRANPRTSGYMQMEAGGGSGLGRLQKARGKK